MNLNKFPSLVASLGRFQFAEGEGSGGDAAAGDPPAGNAPAGDPPASAPPARPDHIPEKFWDAAAGQVNIDNLAKSYTELERLKGNTDALREQFEAERLAARPETPDAYELPQSELLDAEALASSPVVALWRRAAHEAGLGQEQFQKVLTDYAQAEVERAEAAAQAELAKLGENAKVRTEAVSAWASKVFGDSPQFAAVARVASDAAGVEALEKIMGLLADSGVNPGGEGQGGGDAGDTEATIKALMASKEYWSPQHRNADVVARVERFYARTYGRKA